MPGRRTRQILIAAVLGIFFSAAGADAQLWLDAIASSSQPPVGPLNSPSMYAMFGGRIHTTGKGLEIDGSAYAGTGTTAADGQWLTAAAGAARKWNVRGTALQIGADAYGLHYARPFEYTAGVVSLRAAAARRIGKQTYALTLDITRGGWRSVTTPDPLNSVFAEELVTGGLGLETLDATVSQAMNGGTASVTGRALFGAPADALMRIQYARPFNDYDVTVGAAGMFGGITRGGGDITVGRALLDRWYIAAQIEQKLPDLIFTTESTFSVGLTVSWLAAEPESAEEKARIVAVTARSATSTRVVFTLPIESKTGAKKVALVGSFSGWQERPMQRSAQGWTLVVNLKPGSHQFAFLVDGEWVVPKGAPGVVDDGFGRQNATVVIDRL